MPNPFGDRARVVVLTGHAAATSRPREALVSDNSPPAPDVEDSSGWKRWGVLLPALTFVVGLVLGGVVVGVSKLDDTGREGPLVQSSPTPTSTQQSPAPPGSLLITVPAPCVLAAEKGERAYDVLDRAISAARDFDARALAEVVDEVQAERPEVERLVAECQAAAGTRLLQPVPAPTGPTPAATASPS